MKISIGFSPCPNDTFMFAALVNHWIPTEGLDFIVHMEDIETLNEWVSAEKLDLTKMSFHKSLFLQDKYTLLQSGAALGNNCGPMIIAKKSLSKEEILEGPVALPGQWTTAHLLFKHFYPEAKQKEFHRFNILEELVLEDQVKAAVIIHENRFTYASKGLVKVEDLGDSWENETGLPIPLGGIFASNRLNNEVILKLENLIRQSIFFARHNTAEVMNYVREYSQEMEDWVMRSHIDLYVNDFSIDLGPIGNQAITFFKKNMA
jgi:1,4-dihydroxy-6-naphthoate synthase